MRLVMQLFRTAMIMELDQCESRAKGICSVDLQERGEHQRCRCGRTLSFEGREELRGDSWSVGTNSDRCITNAVLESIVCECGIALQSSKLDNSFRIALLAERCTHKLEDLEIDFLLAERMERNRRSKCSVVCSCWNWYQLRFGGWCARRTTGISS
mmetsp:Transcript_9704/g.17489  ORF Transcript_9704/g.17489 Transcript_9704/m.17489 type:complete len:156 (+) Transcript_9704:906-1373(+)